METGYCHRCNEDPADPDGKTFVAPGEREFTLPENPLEENFDTPAMKGSVQAALSRNLGEFVVCEFLIGTASIVSRQGILYAVGMNYFILYEARTQTYVMCDIYSLKFVTFYQPGQRPGNASPSGGRGRR